MISSRCQTSRTVSMFLANARFTANSEAIGWLVGKPDDWSGEGKFPITPVDSTGQRNTSSKARCSSFKG